MPKIRLYVPVSFQEEASVSLHPGQSHYLAHVMRADPGDPVGVFNGENGEWLAQVEAIGKKHVTLRLKKQLAEQRSVPDLWLAFAPIRNKTELVVEKAIELGVSHIFAVFTRHAVVKSINKDKLNAHAIEAAEQCGRHEVPVIDECKDLSALLDAWPKERTLLYGDESGGGRSIGELLSALHPGAYGLLVGPEGGFAEEEHRLLKATSFVKPFTMGPRILRADTAAVSALACMQAAIGDWDKKPAFEPQ